MDGLARHDTAPFGLAETIAVVRWRTDRLLGLGYEPRRASSLAYSQVDIHELERLIRKGCPRETAVRITA